MKTAIYQINKGVNKPIVFKGLQGQYIAWLAAGSVTLMILFSIAYILGANLYFLVLLILAMGGGLFWSVSQLSARFGTHGLEKYFAGRRLPKTLVFRTRSLFTTLRYPKVNLGERSWK